MNAAFAQVVFLVFFVSEVKIFPGDRAITSNNLVTAAPAQNPSQGYAPLPAKGHKESVYALAMNDVGTILVSGGTEKVSCTLLTYFILKASTSDLHIFQQ